LLEQVKIIRQIWGGVDMCSDLCVRFLKQNGKINMAIRTDVFLLISNHRHSFSLTQKQSSYDDCNFIIRMLFYHIY